jgi:hypothetical protein
MTIYKVIVGDEKQVAYESPELNGFEAAKEMLITQLLDTAENDWSVRVEDIEALLPSAEVLTEPDYEKLFFLGQYVHIIKVVE